MSAQDDTVTATRKKADSRVTGHLREAQVDRLSGNIVLEIAVTNGEPQVIHSYFRKTEKI